MRGTGENFVLSSMFLSFSGGHSHQSSIFQLTGGLQTTRSSTSYVIPLIDLHFHAGVDKGRQCLASSMSLLMQCGNFRKSSVCVILVSPAYIGCLYKCTQWDVLTIASDETGNSREGKQSLPIVELHMCFQESLICLAVLLDYWLGAARLNEYPWHFPTTGVFAFGLFATDIFVNAGQVVTGSLAPYFLTVCQPNYTGTECRLNHQFISNGNICTGNRVVVERARRSFPSKDASLSVYSAVYITVRVSHFFLLACSSLVILYL